VPGTLSLRDPILLATFRLDVKLDLAGRGDMHCGVPDNGMVTVILGEDVRKE